MINVNTNASWTPNFRRKQSDQGQSKKRQSFVDGIAHHHGFDPCLASHKIGCQQLRQLPANVVKGGYQTDDNCGAGHGADKERQNGDKGRKPQGETEESAIHDVDGKIMLERFIYFRIHDRYAFYVVIVPDDGGNHPAIGDVGLG